MSALASLLLIVVAGGAEAACDTAAPGALWGSSLVYDPARDNLVLFGGARARRDYVGATWTWSDEGGWLCHDVAGPAARGFAGAAFDPEAGLVVVHGGRGEDNQTLSDTWGWDGRSWRLLASRGPGLDHHRVVWSGVDSALFAFGGWTGTGVAGDSWLWDGESWERLQVEGPPPRSAFAMAYDSVRERLVVHGGLWIEGQYADAWVWDGTRWSAHWPPYANSSMDHHAMVFDRRRERLLVFGGKNYRYRPLGLTLELGDEGFTALSNGGPSPRHSVAFAYDSKRGRAVLFGGKFYRSDEQLALGDLWLFEGSGWRRWPAHRDASPEADSAPPGGAADASPRLEFRPPIP